MSMRNIIFLYVLSLLRPSNTIIQVLNSTFQSLRENIQYQKQPIFLSFSYTFLLLFVLYLQVLSRFNRN